ncbi:hypothetical protein PVAND_013193 [Polypedilum vanderplanki]|uniref:Uncharacterized protein n=1 Tax=Polypedilum vanderplanki TaxID=319348 RepID=A0A9J6CNX1_POLVA|nr:hypothetical protein PVAND_013193 [Polypedilum vanderplanki]
MEIMLNVSSHILPQDFIQPYEDKVKNLEQINKVQELRIIELEKELALSNLNWEEKFEQSKNETKMYCNWYLQSEYTLNKAGNSLKIMEKEYDKLKKHHEFSLKTLEWLGIADDYVEIDDDKNLSISDCKESNSCKKKEQKFDISVLQYFPRHSCSLSSFYNIPANQRYDYESNSEEDENQEPRASLRAQSCNKFEYFEEIEINEDKTHPLRAEFQSEFSINDIFDLEEIPKYENNQEIIKFRCEPIIFDNFKEVFENTEHNEDKNGNELQETVENLEEISESQIKFNETKNEFFESNSCPLSKVKCESTFSENSNEITEIFKNQSQDGNQIDVNKPKVEDNKQPEIDKKPDSDISPTKTICDVKKMRATMSSPRKKSKKNFKFFTNVFWRNNFLFKLFQM